jgi:alcohol dehydrogenase class IV
MFEFTVARLPRIIFGGGTIKQVPELVSGYGKRLLLVTGRQSFQSANHWKDLQKEFEINDITVHHVCVTGEPSPSFIDNIVSQYTGAQIDVVLGIGGGSALDAAKAIAGLLRVNKSVMDYLEGVGPELPYKGPAVPFLAMPTTAGTGSEATKNAVLSIQGKDGFKKSFRDDKLVAEYAIVDPDLLSSCPSTVVAANGMDALTQLIESYVSIKSNEFTDALALSGLRAVRDGLLPFYEKVGDIELARQQMAYAALLSGITLAQVGLGSVHGLASPLGAFYPIPHGVVCGSLVAVATHVNIKVMQNREPENRALAKYARLGEILCQRQFADQVEALASLVDLLERWTMQLHLPRLSDYGVDEAGLDNVIKHCRGSSMKTNPIELTDDEVRNILLQRL